MKVVWASIATNAVEIRMGAPDGLLVSRAGAAGESFIGGWVRDGMFFFLQDVDGGAPLTLSHTLAIARASGTSGSIVEKTLAALRWHWLEARVRARSHLRVHRAEATGYLHVSPNATAPPSENISFASVKLRWSVAGTNAVEVRASGPDGPLISHGSFTGEAVTDEWVVEGTIFYLQNVDGGLPLTREHTLAVARAEFDAP